MLKCKVINKKMSLYIDNQLSGKEAKDFKEHITKCEDCRKEYEQLKSVVLGLHSIQEVYLPDGYKDSLHNKLVEAQYADEQSKKSIIPWYLNWRLYSSLVAGILLVFMFKNQIFDIINEVDKAYVKDIKLQERTYDTFRTTEVENDKNEETKEIESYEQIEEENLPNEPSSQIVTMQTPNQDELSDEQTEYQNEPIVEEKVTGQHDISNEEKPTINEQGEPENTEEQTTDEADNKIDEDDNLASIEDMNASTLQQEVNKDSKNDYEYEENADEEEITMFSIAVEDMDAQENQKSIEDTETQEKDKNGTMYRGSVGGRTMLDVGDSEGEVTKYIFIKISDAEKKSFIEEYPEVIEEYKDRYIVCRDNNLIISLTKEEYDNIEELAKKVNIETEESIEFKEKNEWFEEPEPNDKDIKEEYLLRNKDYEYNVEIEIE